MLETIREFGLEQLEASGEISQIRAAHAAYFDTLVEEIEPNLHGRQQRACFQRLTAELGNLRAVLGRSLNGEIDVQVGLNVAGRLNWFWGLRGFTREGRTWIEALLALPSARASTTSRAWALQSVSADAIGLGSYAAAETYARESVEIFRAVGDLQHAARSLAHLGTALTVLDKHVDARSTLEESASIARELGDRWGLAYALHTLGATRRHQGDFAAARALYEESTAIAREIGDLHTLGLTLAGLAYVARAEGNLAESAASWRQALTTGREFEDHWLLPRAVAGLAGTAVLAGAYERAAELFGIADALRESTGTSEISTWKVIVDRDVAAAREALGEEAYGAARSRGRAMSRDQSVAYALDEPIAPPR
jgi:tetratricopeptide (TPR) repeat protein